jgi:hypothetical protein
VSARPATVTLSRNCSVCPALQLEEVTSPANSTALPADRFPHTVAYAWELTSGDGHDRFDFTLDLLLRGLAPASV